MTDSLSAEGFSSFPLSKALDDSPETSYNILPKLLQNIKSLSSFSTAGSVAASAQLDVPAVSTAYDPRPPHERRSSAASAKLSTLASLDAARSSSASSHNSPNLSIKTSQNADASTEFAEPKVPPLRRRKGTTASLVSSQMPAETSYSPFSAHSHQSARPLAISQAHSYALSHGSHSFQGSLHNVPESPLDTPTSSSWPTAHHLHMFNGIPGFPLAKEGNDDTRSVSSFGGTTMAVSHIFRRIRGEGLSKDYWMADESSKECYDCNTVFTTLRRKHHCRICGQIFCARCASTMFPSSRFGIDGVIRVCDLCLAILKKSDHERSHLDDSVSERMPLATSVRSFGPLQISAPLETQVRQHKSHLNASILFPRSDSLALSHPFAVNDELFVRNRRTSDLSVLRPQTPDSFDNGDLASPLHQTHRPGLGSPLALALSPSDSPAQSPRLDDAVSMAPFRKTIREEDKLAAEALLEGSPAIETADMGGAVAKSPKPTSTLATPSTSRQASPNGSAKDPAHSLTINPPRKLSFQSILSPTKAGSETPSSSTSMHRRSGLLRPRVPSRGIPISLQDPNHPDILKSSMELGALPSIMDLMGLPPNHTLNDICANHLEALLRQMLRQQQIPKAEQWECVLLQILHQVVRWPQLDVRSGDSMNINSYIRVKRIPGGSPKNSEYVHGVVFTKNLLHKGMPRSLTNPRIMLLSFALEYQRTENQITSLEALLLQEQQYLRNLVGRVLAQRPHIVLCERNISSLALKYLHEAKVAVARNVKPSVIAAIARATNADVIVSMDRLALEPRPGRCSAFKVDTRVHKLIPGGRKTVLRFEGCVREAGASIILRGADMPTLAKVKSIVRLLATAAYSMRLETFLFADERVMLRPPVPLEELDDVATPESSLPTVTLEKTPTPNTANDYFGRPRKALDEVSKCLKPYKQHLLSTSPSIKIIPPHTLIRIVNSEQIIHSPVSHSKEETITQATLQPPLAIPRAAKSGEPEGAMLASDAMKQDLADVSLGEILDVDVEPFHLQTVPKLLASLETDRAEQHLKESLRLVEEYQSHHQDSLDPFDHQKIMVLESIVCTRGAPKLCQEPKLITRHFYGENDLTLGQFIEQTIETAACPNKACPNPIIAHEKYLVHGQYRLIVTVGAWLCPIPGNEDCIIMNSGCELCVSERIEQPTYGCMTPQTWNYSFGKFLQLAFYNEGVFNHDVSCPHNPHADYSRYFWFKNKLLTLGTEEIVVFDTIVPSVILQMKPDDRLLLRNEEFELIQRQNATYWTSVINRIKGFNYELLTVDRIDAARTTMDTLCQKAEADQVAFAQLLQKTYTEDTKTSGSALNAVRRALQNAIFTWDEDFAAFEQRFFPAEKDVRRLTSVQLKRLFSDSSTPGSPESKYSAFPSRPPSIASESDIETRSITPSIHAQFSGAETGGSRISSPTALSHAHLAQHNSTLIDGSETASTIDSNTPTASVASTVMSAIPSSRTWSAASARLPNISDEDDSDSTVVGEDQRPCPIPTLTFEKTKPRRESQSDDEMSPPRGYKPYRGRHSGIARLVQQYEPQPSEARGGTRPPMRRGKSDTMAYKTTVTVSNETEETSTSPETSTTPALNPSQPVKRSNSNRSKHAERQSRIPSRIAKASNSLGVMLQSIPNASTEEAHSSSKPPPTSRTMRPNLSRNSSAASSATNASSEAGTGRGSIRGRSKAGTSSSKEKSTTSKEKGSRTLSKVIRKVSASGPPGRVSAITKHFDNISREADRDKQSRFAALRIRRARPVTVAKPTVEVFHSVKDAEKEDSDDERDRVSSSGSEGADDEYEKDDDRVVSNPLPTLPSTDALDNNNGKSRHGKEASTASNENFIYDNSIVTSPIQENENAQSLVDRSQGGTLPVINEPAAIYPPSPALSSSSFVAPRIQHLSESEMSSSGTERNSLIKTLSNLWNYRGGEFLPLEYPLAISEHIFESNPIIIREDEPSSLIAFTLSSKAYKDMLKQQEPLKPCTERFEDFMPEEYQSQNGDRGSTWGIVDLQQPEFTDAEETLKKPAAKHFRLQFEEGSSRFSTKIFFSEQFDALRKNCGCEDQFIESLARCIKWDAAGGKSGSAFLKTKDDRFIVKEISRLEMQALLNFAPHYFEYMSRAFFHQLPTVLAKIFGFFRISFKNSATGKSMRLDVLVTENVYYRRTVQTKYDFKGSTRNRKAAFTGNPEEVLLDENFTEFIHKCPFFLHEQSKRHLETALWNDSLFLSKLNVMDFSLIVGVDKINNEIVVGIVDYARTYTWDKRVESWVKEAAFIGGAAGAPTVITPKLYKTRFREAMARYFVLSPDTWTSGEAIQSVKERSHSNNSAETYASSISAQ